MRWSGVGRSPPERPVTAFTHHGLQSVGQRRNQVGEPCALQNLTQIFFGGIRSRKEQVGSKALVETGARPA